MKIGIDPGMVSGVVAINNIVNADQFDVIGVGEMLWHNRFWFRQYFAKHHQEIEKIVIEEYRLYKHKAADQTNSLIPSVRIIGIVEAYAFEFDLFDKIVYQPAYMIKSGGHYTINILDQHTALFKGYTREHTKDAYRHLRKHLKG